MLCKDCKQEVEDSKLKPPFDYYMTWAGVRKGVMIKSVKEIKYVVCFTCNTVLGEDKCVATL